MGDDALINGIAETTLLPVKMVRRRLDQAHGKALIRNVFVDEWPDLAGELGWYTVAGARNVGLADRIAQVTNLDPRLVNLILDTTGSRIRLKNAFASFWPGCSDDELRATALRELFSRLSVSKIREYDLFAELGRFIGLEEADVRHHLENVRGHKLLGNVTWDPTSTVQTDEAHESDSYSDEFDSEKELGDRRVTWARNHDAIQEIASLTGLSSRVVRNRLDTSNGNRLIKNLFADKWPTTAQPEVPFRSNVPEDVAIGTDIGSLRVSQAIEYDLLDDIAQITGLKAEVIQKRLGASRGNTLVRNVFASTWSASVADDSSDIVPPSKPRPEVQANTGDPRGSHTTWQNDPALDELKDIYQEGRLVLFVGAGVSMAAGLPSWKGLVEQLMEHPRARALPHAELTEISDLIDRKNFNEALAALKDALGGPEFCSIVERNLTYSRKTKEIPKIAREIANLYPDLRAVLTTNLDKVLEAGHSQRSFYLGFDRKGLCARHVRGP